MHDRDTETVDGPVVAVGAGALPTGAVVAGRYRIERLLGRGGSALVYAARDLQLLSDVALKILRSERVNETGIKRLRREVAIARRAASPRLIRVFDIGESAEGVYLTMELFDAPTLRSSMAGKPLPIPDVITLATAVVESVGVLHSLGIVHRDVKPGNILVRANGEVKLADFGLAIDLEADESRLTQTSGLVGTLEYLPPEQALGTAVDARSDLYSVGMVLFEMLTGRLPFDSNTTIGTVVAHLQRRAPDVRTIRRDTPAWLARLVAALLEKDPARRIQTAGEVAAILRRRKMPLMRRIRWGAVAAALLLVAAGFLAWSIVSRDDAFARVALTGDGLTAVDNSGKTLWVKRSARPYRSAAVVRRAGRPAFIAVVADGPPDTTPAAAHRLQLLDPSTGVTLREVDLPQGSAGFLGFAPAFRLISLAAADLNGDGNDIVIASFAHLTYWPSYIDVYDPVSGTSGTVFYGSGHHRFGAAVDVNGDGRKDLILYGINNRMGWHAGVAAIDVTTTDVPGSAVRRYYTGCSPDSDVRTDADRSVLWYALLPSGHPVRIGSIDVQRRRFNVEYEDRHVDTLSFDGFTSQSPVDAALRARHRGSCYENLREALRLASGNFRQESTAAIDKARDEAVAAQDADLLDWVRRQRAALLVRFGRLEEGEREVETAFQSPLTRSEVAFDAGRAFHLHGDVERAAAWYHRGVGVGSGRMAGRGTWEFFEGEVLALGEAGRWDDARRAAQQFGEQLPSQILMVSWLKQYIEWRTGAAITNIPAAAESAPDEMRYWRLEFLRRNGTPSAELLKAIDAEKKRSSYDTLLESLRGEVLGDLGRTQEAYAAARNAYESANAERASDTAVRAEFDVIAKRFAARAKAAAIARR